MKGYIIMGGICLLFLSATTQDSIQTEASRITDRQLDSISKPIGNNQVVISFSDVKNHMDSLNVQVLRLLNETAMASRKRDSLTHGMIRLISENMSLKASNERYKKEWSSLHTGMNVMFWSLVVYLASLAAQGSWHGYNEWRDSRKKK